MNTNTLNKRLWRILSAMLTVAMILTSVSIPAFAADKTDVSAMTEFSETTDISSADAFKISSADALKAFAAAVKDDNGNGTYSMSGKTFYLANDIDLQGTAFTPIADVSYPVDGFAGTFDGNYYTIKGLYVNGTTMYKGLFGILNGGTIKNVAVEGTVTSTNNYVGGIVGKIVSGSVENCGFKGTVESTKSKAYVGGIAGYCGNGKTQKGTIKGCVNEANVKAATNGYAGGITAYAKFSTIENCYNTGKINGAAKSGGIVGQAMNSTPITNCYNVGELSGSTTAADICDFFGGSEISNSFYSKNAIKSGGTGKVNENCGKIPSENFASILGNAFVEDSDNINNGYPILSWQKSDAPVQPKNPSISISGGRTLKMTNSGAQPTTTLTVDYTDMDTTPTVKWSVESGKENMITLAVPETSDTSDNIRIVKPISAGKIKVTAKVVYDSNEYTADADIVIYPYVTTVDIDGHINVGETVRAKVNVLDGEYDYANLPELAYQWKYLTNEDYLAGKTGSGSYKNISGAIKGLHHLLG